MSVAGLASLMAASSASGQHYLLKANAAIKEAQLTAFLDNIEKAEQWAPASFIDPEVQLAGLYIDILSGAGILFETADKDTMFSDAHGLLNNAESMNPIWAEVDYKRGKLHMTVKDADSAVVSWENALTKNPMHTKARMELAKMFVARGRPAEAYDLLAAGLGYPHDNSVTQEYGKVMQAIEALAQMQKKYKEGMQSIP